LVAHIGTPLLQTREQFVDSVQSPPAPALRAAGGGDQIFFHAQGGKDLPALRHQRNAHAPYTVWRQAGQIGTLEADAAAAGPEQAEQALDDWGAAHSVAADQSHDLALVDVELHIEQSLRTPVFGC